MPHNGKRMEKNQEKSVLTARKKPFGNIKKGICLMKKIFCTVLMLCLVLSLAACGQTNSNNSSNSTPGSTPESSVPESSMPESAGTEETETQTISGIVNRLGNYLVLLDDQDNYLIFDFGEDVDSSTLAEGDRVTVTYTGELGSEDPSPVAVDIQVAP